MSQLKGEGRATCMDAGRRDLYVSQHPPLCGVLVGSVPGATGSLAFAADVLHMAALLQVLMKPEKHDPEGALANMGVDRGNLKHPEQVLAITGDRPDGNSTRLSSCSLTPIFKQHFASRRDCARGGVVMWIAFAFGRRRPRQIKV